MKKVVLLVLLASALAGCDDFPLEGGERVMRGGHGHHHDDLVQQR
ncbi:MAG TPA: hypothetical protein VIU46_08020 [Gallionellaceae bacterium]